MRPLFLTSGTVVSAMGRGQAATLDSLRSRRSGLRPCDFADIKTGYIGRVDSLESHKLPAKLARFDCRNNRLADLALRTDGFERAIDSAHSRYQPERVAVLIGTSTSGVLSSEDAYCHRDPDTGSLPGTYDFEHTHDMFSVARYVRAMLGLRGPAMVVSNACASSARVFADAHHLIESDTCDAAVVGGVDTLCRMTLCGFAALELISPVPCRPCDAERNGLSIGEAAGFALLEREGDGIALLGYGVSSDGYHMSAPHPEAAGAIAAMSAALQRAGLGPDEIDYINLHGTGTKSNDAAEDRGVTEVFGTGTRCSSTKGWSGHALGAAGILEAMISVVCIRHGLLPGCLNVTAIDPGFRARVMVENETGLVRRVISNSFGFGGSNCSLVLGTA
ncbi:MAG: beta-ketoacyl-[acyl-carrier-protein] synthase family protein [Acetobacteraceae bacterium]|nr:beta-ketoacyl-[acyl-carrier-protein] synthase family protein [Acetobacteraceae bacterium]